MFGLSHRPVLFTYVAVNIMYKAVKMHHAEKMLRERENDFVGSLSYKYRYQIVSYTEFYDEHGISLLLLLNCFFKINYSLQNQTLCCILL